EGSTQGRSRAARISRSKRFPGPRSPLPGGGDRRRLKQASRLPEWRGSGGGAGSRRSSAHPADLVRVQGLEAMTKQQNQCQADGHWGRGNRQNENVHALPARGLPARAGRDEGQARSIQHDFDGKKNEDDVPPQDDTSQADREQESRESETA